MRYKNETTEGVIYVYLDVISFGVSHINAFFLIIVTE